MQKNIDNATLIFEILRADEEGYFSLPEDELEEMLECLANILFDMLEQQIMDAREYSIV